MDIRATDGSGKPTGSDLCNGTTNGDTLTTNQNGEWREISLGSGCSLAAGTMYAIVTRAIGGYGYGRLTGTDLYPTGLAYLSQDNGGSWLPYPSDLLFEDWGTPS